MEDTRLTFIEVHTNRSNLHIYAFVGKNLKVFEQLIFQKTLNFDVSYCSVMKVGTSILDLKPLKFVKMKILG